MTIATEEGPLRRGAVRPGERALAPDLARGIMLLGIVLSNTAFHLWAARRGPSGWQPVDGSWLDHAVQFTMIIALDLRVYPLFAFLFGYGMTQLYLRQTAAGTDPRDAARILRRRSLWLIVIGLTHATLLMAGDIIGFYGVLSLVLGLAFLRRGERALTWWIWVGVALILLVSAGPALSALLRGELGTFGDAGADPGFKAYASQEANWLTAAGTRLRTGLFVTFVAAPLTLVGGGFILFLLGFRAARRRILEEPGRHRTLLRLTALLGIAVGWLGALPAALAHIGVLHVPDVMQSESGALTVLRDITGNAAGLGYVAAVALFAHWWTARGPRRGATAVAAVTSVGKRSLSCYLAHSLLFAPVLAAWGLGLGEQLGSATMALFALAVWLVTVAGAYALERAGRRGPAEAVLRRLMYGRRAG
ncbi:DUF418 domain-containing protein [Streptomyces purpurascens]|uniref:DUF418 domain-containing protein n=1 Tax=Streptomyces purpurascens TaxID=1924 RepID=UPI0016773A94|nr:DUF418 domain-containing protein [Streptomyces purpurascens]MCE7048251.1 DUF418 domain-containing protein [Streptomyces purpurascens]GHA26448.1 hypothetical protein GCM10010303_41400 [Streptomyces purpurascens]